MPTSKRTETLARELGIQLTTLEEIDGLDLGIDGADEIDPALDAIKGRGGALLHEKLVALSCADYVLVATTEKRVDRLGERIPLPVEIVSLGWRQTASRLAALGIAPKLRPSLADPKRPWQTDNGGYLLDCATGPITDPYTLAATIKATSGVVEHGLFLDIARAALQVDPEGNVTHRERLPRADAHSVGATQASPALATRTIQEENPSTEQQQKDSSRCGLSFGPS